MVVCRYGSLGSSVVAEVLVLVLCFLTGMHNLPVTFVAF